MKRKTERREINFKEYINFLQRTGQKVNIPMLKKFSPGDLLFVKDDPIRNVQVAYYLIK